MFLIVNRDRMNYDSFYADIITDNHRMAVTNCFNQGLAAAFGDITKLEEMEIWRSSARCGTLSWDHKFAPLGANSELICLCISAEKLEEEREAYAALGRCVIYLYFLDDEPSVKDKEVVGHYNCGIVNFQQLLKHPPEGWPIEQRMDAFSLNGGPLFYVYPLVWDITSDMGDNSCRHVNSGEIADYQRMAEQICDIQAIPLTQNMYDRLKDKIAAGVSQ